MFVIKNKKYWLILIDFFFTETIINCRRRLGRHWCHQHYPTSNCTIVIVFSMFFFLSTMFIIWKITDKKHQSINHPPKNEWMNERRNKNQYLTQPNNSVQFSIFMEHIKKNWKCTNKIDNTTRIIHYHIGQFCFNFIKFLGIFFFKRENK